MSIPGLFSWLLKISWLLMFLFSLSCVSYYQMNHRFNAYFTEGEIDKAEKVLAGSKKAPEGKARLLYYLNRGVVSFLQGEYEESNDFFEQAYILGEDLRNNYWNTASSLLMNPNFTFYTGEDHELLLLHYFKALNFLKMGQNEQALVECRRLNIKLQGLSSKYKAGVLGKKGKYTRDAFIHNLMGIIYEADRDYNNAFIAYRNAADIYREDYLPMFGIDVPEQLRQDLLRTAHIMGFEDEKHRYEALFGITYEHQPQAGGELVFFWNNGLGPVKDQWGINFALLRSEGDIVNFSNDEFGFNFPFKLENEQEYERKNLDDVEFIRVAFPRYLERPVVFDEAVLKAPTGALARLEKAEDVNGIAFQVLQQRMLKEFSSSLLRVAVKKAAEYSVRKENNDLGAVISLVNAVTEQADTRNWQTIPHSIYYTRMPLPEGQQTVSLELNGRTAQSHEFIFDIKKGKTVFQTFHSLEAEYRMHPF
ncbi:MAG: COG3014 family protein [Cyclobacteriaceae bacterium]